MSPSPSGGRRSISLKAMASALGILSCRSHHPLSVGASPNLRTADSQRFGASRDDNFGFTLQWLASRFASSMKQTRTAFKLYHHSTLQQASTLAQTHLPHGCYGGQRWTAWSTVWCAAWSSEQRSFDRRRGKTSPSFRNTRLEETEILVI